MYDEIREYEAGSVLPATPKSNFNAKSAEAHISSLYESYKIQGIEYLIDAIARRITYEIKKASGESIVYNSGLDKLKPKYARVPTGPETCEWCIMLASRGYDYASAKTAGALTHWHENCDCIIVPQFSNEWQVKGYDPEKYQKIWYDNVVYDEYGHVDSKASLKNIRAWTGRDADYYKNHKAERHEYYEYVKENGLLGTTKRGSGRRSSRSKYQFEGGDGVPSFRDFNDVKSYLYDSSSEEDLYHRYSVLGNIFGHQSEQMTSAALKNVLKTAKHKFE